MVILLWTSPSFCQGLPSFAGSYKGDAEGIITQNQDGYTVKITMVNGMTLERNFVLVSPHRFQEKNKKDPFRDGQLCWATFRDQEFRVFDLSISKKGDSSLRRFAFTKDNRLIIKETLSLIPQDQNSPITYDQLKPFFGTYEGDAVSQLNASVRHLKLFIMPFNDGFKLVWETLIRSSQNKDLSRKRKAAFTFLPTAVPGLYRQDMRVSIFEKARRLDFTKGEPLVWAVLYKRTLTAVHLILDDNHDYNLQIYRRTLSEDAASLDLQFSCDVDGTQSEVVKGTLRRKDPTQNSQERPARS